MLQHALPAALATLDRLPVKLVLLGRLMWMVTLPLRVSHATLELTQLSRRHRVSRVLKARPIQTPMRPQLASAVQLGSTLQVVT